MTRQEAWVHFVSGALAASDLSRGADAVTWAASMADDALNEMDKRFSGVTCPHDVLMSQPCKRCDGGLFDRSKE